MFESREGRGERTGPPAARAEAMLPAVSAALAWAREDGPVRSPLPFPCDDSLHDYTLAQRLTEE
jgi:hypothetical protein